MNRHDPRLHAAARRHAHALRNAAFADAADTLVHALRHAWAAFARPATAHRAPHREAACRS